MQLGKFLKNGVLMDREKIISLFGEKAVIDNNIICDFKELECIELLNKVFTEVLIPQSILEDEVKQCKRELEKINYQPVCITELQTYDFMVAILNRHGGLTDYDAEVVAIAYEKYVLCTSNEKRIMTTCKENNINYTGTVGILCCAFEKGIIKKDELKRMVDKLKNQCTCFISDRVINDVYSTYALV